MKQFCADLCKKIDEHFSLSFVDYLVNVTDLHSSVYAEVVYFTYCGMSFRYSACLFDDIWYYKLGIYCDSEACFVTLFFSES